MTSPYDDKNHNKGYHDTGIDEDTAQTMVDAGRMVTNFMPGGKVAQGVVDTGLAAVRGDVEREKDERRLDEAGLGLKTNAAKWNPHIKNHRERLAGRWKGRAGEAVSSAGGAAAGGALGFGLAGAMGLAGGFAVPVIGAPIGAAIGTGLGGVIGAYGTSKAYNAIVPFDEKDEVDLTIKIDEAQKKGMEIPPEAVFAQWAAQQKGAMDTRLKEELRAATGLANFNDAIEQGKLPELSAMMNKREYATAMRTYFGMMPDANNPDRHVASQLAEWINAGQLQAKDLLLGRDYTPNMSLQDAQREGYLSDPVLSQSIGKTKELMDRNRDRNSSLSI